MIGEAEARRDATIAEAHAEEQRMEAKLKNDTEIARCPLDTMPIFNVNKHFSGLSGTLSLIRQPMTPK